ncbi:MAG: serine/threonine-protein kinase [Anaerolineales bacterium]|nr:serine/threonine-protein kinase [Anaerolineales bacterium]
MPPQVAPKTLLNQYRIEEFISLTPLGELYRAIDERSNKSVALTVLSKDVSDKPENIKDFEANASRLLTITHPNLNKHIGLGKTSERTFLVEEWVDGPSVRDILEQGRVSAKESLFVAKSVCSGLEALHNKGLLHLHLSPELIRINKRGEVILCGAAGARVTNPKVEVQLGKYPLHYVPPEQLLAQPLTRAADIYSLAVILYQLTTGKWINGKSAPRTSETTRKTHLDSTPPAPASLVSGIPDNFSRMVLWALRKDPNDRLKTTVELTSSLALALQTSLDKIPPRATPEAAPVITAVLKDWEFLPPPKTTSVSADAIPLEERLAAISTPKKKAPQRIGFVPIFLFVLVAGFLALAFFIRPAAETPLPTPIVYTSFKANITPQPTTSPTPYPTLTNSGRIVFTCTRGDYNQLCMINGDGSDLVQLTDMAASNYYPAFADGGDSILFASNRGGPFDLFRLNFSQKEVFQITLNVGNVISPDYSPDERFIVFANRVGDGPTAIWMVNADGLNPHLVYTGSGDIVSVAWSPDGERIAYAMNMGKPQEYEIFTMDTNGRNHLRISQKLLGIGGSVDWSPDGSSLLVYAGPFGDKDIFKINAATGEYTQLTFGGNNAGASYSPDGQYIVFNSLRNNDQADLYTMKADGSGMRQITNDPEPDWGAKWVE